MNNNYYEPLTTKLEDFGYRELDILRRTLNAFETYGLPEDFEPDNVTPMFNKDSGYVFLTNEEYQVAMLNGEELESWYTLDYHGNEGFIDDLLFDYESGNIGLEDYEQLADICEINGFLELAEEIRNELEEAEEITED